jgi:ribosome-associated protein
MQIFTITEEFIHLNQLLKALGWCEHGGEANAAIDGGQVRVNGTVELRKRNKIRDGFEVEFRSQKAVVRYQP